MSTNSKDKRPLATKGPRSSGMVCLPVSYVEARQATKDAAESLERCTVKTESKDTIIVEVAKGWTTHGELLHVSFIVTGEETEVRITTEQVMPTTRFDFGQARRDVERLLKTIEGFAMGNGATTTTS